MTMKQFMIVALAMVVVVAFATPILADEAAQATAFITAHVNPNISLHAITTNVDAGTIQTGNISAFSAFRIDANSEEVYFQVEASNLYKAGDPSSSNFLVLATGIPAIVQPVDGAPVGLHGNALAWTGGIGAMVLDGIYSLPTALTEQVQYQSSQAGVFSQEVDVTVTWSNANGELPVGEYKGVVVLLATLLPATGI
jgi:hypothetical protein